MSKPLPEYVLSLLDGIAVSEGFCQYQIKTGAGSKHGDGGCGTLTIATIAGDRTINGTIQKDTLALLCKTMPSTQGESILDKLFEREVLAYNQLLPLFAKFQREKGLSDEECFNTYPTCYAAVADATNNKYIVIMEDLRARKFVLWPKAQSFDNTHAFAVIDGLAKLHAVSFALRDQRPEEFKIILY